MNWITALLTVADWAITRAEADGETIPPELIEARTALRRKVVEDAAAESTPDE